MSKSREARPPEGYHQEYIASLRYRNDLPPPEMPPKFLEIPHEGLERFLAPGFASNLARREDPNIDVDAEGGMSLDLVGIPGLHLGDESAIMAPENPAPLDPADLPLLMTLDQLRNPAPKNSNVSFLRRTQYIASGAGGRNVDTKSFMAPRPKVQKPKPSRDDPAHIKKYILKGFDIAYPKSKHMGEDTESRIRGLAPTKAEMDAWANPVHPDNPKLKPVGFYPFVPDLGGFTDHGGLFQMKFDKAPVQDDKGKRDDRMDVSLLLPQTPEDRVVQEYNTKVALHKANPALYPDPGPRPNDFTLYLPERQGAVNDIKKSMNLAHPDRDDPSLYTHEGPEGQRYHKYDRVRTYATTSQVFNTESRYKDVSVILFDPEQKSEDNDNDYHRLTQKGAYYSPILTKIRLKPERSRTIAQAGLAPTAPQNKEDMIHQIMLTMRDPNEAEAHKRARHRALLDPAFAKTLPPSPEPEEAPAEDKNVDVEMEMAEAGHEENDAAEFDRGSESASGSPRRDAEEEEE